MTFPRGLVLTAAVLFAGCAAPDPGNPAAPGELVLYMTSATHSGSHGIHLAPLPGTTRVTPPATCDVDAGTDAPEGLVCTISDGTWVDFACGDAEPERSPWVLDVHWRGSTEREGWTVTARGAEEGITAVWTGAELACQGHLTE